MGKNDLDLLEAWWLPIAVGILALISILVVVLASDNAHGAEIVQVRYTADDLLAAIYRAEGGKNTRYPYGIRSVRCDSVAECRQICLNTIVNNVRRFRDYGHKTHKDYLSFLASRYAPINADNDPNGLNNNWLKNVRFFLREGAGR